MPTISGPGPISLAGRPGQLYRVDDPSELSGVAPVDECLSSFPVAVFLTDARPAAETPVVVALNGMAAPYGRLAPLVPALLGMGIACVLVETPFAGERGLTRGSGDILAEVRALASRGVPITARLVLRLFEAVSRDVATAFQLAEERHGLTDGRRALFGVSLGTLLGSYAFTRDGLGSRLLGTIGHADLARFARSYLPPLPPAHLEMVARSTGPEGMFVRLLTDLASGQGDGHEANPMTHIDRVAEGRRARFLVGAADPVVRAEDALASSRRFPDGDCQVIPGLGHGGPGFEERAGRFLAEQLADWSA